MINESKKIFSDTLIRLNTKIEELGRVTFLNSDHIYSEYFFRDLLNICIWVFT